MVVLSNPIDCISSGFDLCPQLGLTCLQLLTGLTDTQTACWRCRLHQTCHVVTRQTYPNRAGAGLLFTRHNPLACPKHNRVRTRAELLSGAFYREQPITAWLSIARRNRTGTCNTMPPPTIHHPSVGPGQPLLGHQSALLQNLGNLVIRMALRQIADERHHARIQSMRIARGRACDLQGRDTASNKGESEPVWAWL